MHITIATVFSELYEPFLRTSLIKRAQEDKIVSVVAESFFSCVAPKERIDAPPFGAGSGMLIKPEVFETFIARAEEKHGPAFKIFFSPQGVRLDQPLLENLATILQERSHVLMVASRYEGIDERVEQEYADLVISAGDFVLMGGDLPALMVLEGMLRLVPGIVGKQESVTHDSFSGPFVDYPTYTSPVEWRGRRVPDVIRSGHHGAVAAWRLRHAVYKSVRKHFSWVRSHPTTVEQRTMIAECIPPHYVLLSHTDVLIAGEKGVGNTSVTSIDLHDIARSSRTYGIKEFLVVTALIDQQKIVQKLVDFWQDRGAVYNANRHDAIRLISIHESVESAMRYVAVKEGIDPLLVTTSARIDMGHGTLITYHQQEVVWNSGRPVVLVFGTGQGLRQELLAKSDYQLLPIEGFSNFNHLSVRSAVAIILDRWLGVNYARITRS